MNAGYRRAWAVFGCVAVLPAVSAGAAILTVNTTEPTGPGVVIANPHTTFSTATPGPLGERDTFTTAFSAAATSGVEARGQSFLMPDNPTGPAWDLSAVTLRADANTDGSGFAQDFSTGGAHLLRLWIFEWNPNTSATTGTQWTAGDGGADGDHFDGTGINNFLVNGEAFDVTRAFSGEFLHFSTPGVQLSENTAYGYLVRFESPGTTGLRFDQVRDNVAPNGQSYANGAFIRSDATTPFHPFGPSGDDMVFYVEATPVPEPAAATLLGVAGVVAATTRGIRRQH